MTRLDDWQDIVSHEQEKSTYARNQLNQLLAAGVINQERHEKLLVLLADQPGRGAATIKRIGRR